MTLLSTTWSRSPDVAFVDDGLRVVILPLEQSLVTTPLLLQGIAADVWRELAAPRTTTELIDGIASKHDAPSSVSGLAPSALDALLANGLVVQF
jgi:hypothetical protein